MSDEIQYTLKEAQEKFAKQTNGRVWELLQKTDRTAEETEEMIHAAHASLYHWLHVGTAVHQQRGEWLIAHIYTVLEDSQKALHYARRCLKVTEANMEQMADFDLAFAYEGIARAHALAGNLGEAKSYHEKARAAGEAIAGEEDKQIFLGDFEGGRWYGVK